MSKFKNLSGKQITVCYIYHNDGNLFKHCQGTGKYIDNIFSIIRKDQEPFYISEKWKTEIIELKEEHRESFGMSQFLVAVHAVHPEQLNGKNLSIVFWLPDDSAYILDGQCNYSDNSLVLLHKNGEGEFNIYTDWFPRIKLISNKQKELLQQSEYLLSLNVGNLPEGVNLTEYNEVGITLK